YEMCTGMLPFRGDTSGVIFESILNRAPAPALRLNPDLPPKLEEIVSKCLEKDRNLRYQHASEIRTDLQRLKRDTESGRLAVRIATPGRRWVKNSMLVLGGIVLIVMVGLLALRQYLLPQSQTVSSIAVLPFTSPNPDANTEDFDDGITEGIIDTLSQMPNLKVMSRSAMFRFKNSNSDPQKVGRELKVGAVLTG